MNAADAAGTHGAGGGQTRSPAPLLGPGPTHTGLTERLDELTERTEEGIRGMTVGPDALGLLLPLALHGSLILTRRRKARELRNRQRAAS